MLHTTGTQDAKHAPLSAFMSSRPRRFSGDDLRDIDRLQASILRHGLLSPITVLKNGDRLTVLDGRKRLAAIKRLAFEGCVPRSLSHIPYRKADSLCGQVNQASVLLNNRELYRAMSDDFAAGQTPDEIARNYHVSRQCVRDVLTLKRLSVIIREAFFTRLIDFAQARAYASLPDKADQLSRFRTLGPFAPASTILDETEPRRIRDHPPLSVVAA